MLIALRRRLGRIRDKLERHVETMSSGGKRRAPAPLSDADKAFMLEWLKGSADDAALVERARTGGAGAGLIERACAARPANAIAWAARAGYCLDAGDLEEAIDHAERAVALGRHEPDATSIRVRVLVAAQRRDEALEAMPAALENARRMRRHAMRLDLCALWQGLEPESLEPPLEAARTRMATRELDRAAAELEALTARFGNRFDILMPLAAVYQDQLRTRDAMRTFQQAVDAEPDNVDALCMAGLCARDLGDTAGADRMLEHALERDPASTFVQYNLGLLRLDEGRIDAAAGLLLGARDARRGKPWDESAIEKVLDSAVKRDFGGAEWATARFKLNHDIEQLGYLRGKGLLGPAIEPVIAEHRLTLADEALPADTYSMVALDPLRYPRLARTYKAPLHAPDPDPPGGALVNPALAWASIEDEYLAAAPHLVVVDDLLGEDALAALRAYCLESTFWNDLKGGYLGATMPDGFSGRLLLRIAAELRARLPRLLGARPLRTMWAYKYDPAYPGIGLHADAGAVNVNFWITPDQANLDPESGGLVVYSNPAPRDGSVERFTPDGTEIRRYLDSVDAKAIRVPYRANRAVIFDSALFHESDAFRFRDGYENRRTSMTLLYGTPE